MKPSFAASAGNSRPVVIVVLLVISALAAIWTYWPDLERMITPGPTGVSAVAPPPVAPVAPPSAAPEKPNLRLRSQAGIRSAPRETPPEEKLGFLLLEEPLPEEPESSLPEMLKPIKASGLEGAKQEERARAAAEKRKRDAPTLIRDYLNGASIGGVRVAGPMSKLLFNGEVFQVGETVSKEYNVSIHRVTSRTVVFRDGQGNEYPVKY